MLRIIRQIRRISKLAEVICIILLIGACSNLDAEDIYYTPIPTVEPTEHTEISTYIPTENRTDIFTKEEIPEDVRDQMWNVTINENSAVGFSDLSYLTVTYMGYDDKSHEGHLIVDKTLADEVLNIFKELYNINFPIEKMNLPCEYGGVDELSMEDNNTSAFNNRPIEGTNTVSNHALGRAIDINPLINPYIKYSTDTVLPTIGRVYLDRTSDNKGIITKDSECVKIFEKYGWTWGGNWNSLKDYQHFEKDLYK